MNLEKAIKIATKAHEGQFRKNKQKLPYISHPLAVMDLVKVYYSEFFTSKMYMESALMVAVLHDVIEDSNMTAKDLLAEGFSCEVVDAVVALTEVKGEDYLQKVIRANNNSIAKLVKYCDITHNMSDGSRNDNKHRYDKYELAKYILQR